MKYLVIMSVIFSVLNSCQNNSDNTLTEKTSYYPNKQIRLKYQIDEQGKKQGLYKLYNNTGVKISESQYYNNKEVVKKEFYSNGKTKSCLSYNIIDNVVNTYIYFDKDGEISELSEYLNLKFLKQDKKILISHIDNREIDSLVLHVKVSKGKRESEDIRKLVIPHYNDSEFIFTLSEKDYINNQVNLVLERYTTTTYEGSSKPLTSLTNLYYIQLDKGEIPAKYNIDPIW